jgi:MFS family permease
MATDTRTAQWRSITIPPEALASLRRRTVWTLFGGVALGSTGYIAAATAGTLAAEQLGGSAAFAGLPTTAAVLGTASGTVLLSTIMLRRGRRPGMLAGLGLGALGAAVALVALLIGSLPLLIVGSFFGGWGNAAAQLARYVAADLFAPDRRASAIGTVVWGATIGAVIGPNLIAPAGEVASSVGVPDLAGAYGVMLLVGLFALVVAFVLLRPEPYALADQSALESQKATEAPLPVTTLLQRRPVAVALTTMLAGQVVMVLIMTMTPLHLDAHGHGLGVLGLVLSAHTFGMFALSPISGRLTDRFGSPAVIAAGLATLAAAAILAAVASPHDSFLLAVALFLLGYGWNLGLVAGSALLARGLGLAERTRLQGVTDAVIWLAAAAASVGSGLIVAGASYTALGFFGLLLLVGPALLLAASLPRLRPATA